MKNKIFIVLAIVAFFSVRMELVAGDAPKGVMVIFNKPLGLNDIASIRSMQSIDYRRSVKDKIKKDKKLYEAQGISCDGVTEFYLACSFLLPDGAVAKQKIEDCKTMSWDRLTNYYVSENLGISVLPSTFLKDNDGQFHSAITFKEYLELATYPNIRKREFTTTIITIDSEITELTITVKGKIDSVTYLNTVAKYVDHNKKNYEKLGFIIKQGGQGFLMLESATCLKDGLLINLIQDGLVYPSDKPYKLGIGSSLPVDIITVPLIWPAGCLISNKDVFFNFNDKRYKANIVLPKKENESNIVLLKKENESNIVLLKKENESNIVLPKKENESNIVLPKKENESNIVLPKKENESNIVLPKKENESNIVLLKKDNESSIVLLKKDNESSIVVENEWSTVLSEQNDEINALGNKVFFYRSLFCLGMASFVALAYLYKNSAALQFFLNKFS